MEQLQRRMASRPFAILALSVDESWHPVNRFMKDTRTDAPGLRDFDKKSRRCMGLWCTRKPTSSIKKEKSPTKSLAEPIGCRQKR